jgi:ADP-heptose:LPS heptosyltransferase
MSEPFSSCDPSTVLARYRTDCRHFTGFRPCAWHRPCAGCPHIDPYGPSVLLLNLDALGDVLRNTALLPAIHRALPGARITWLTRPRAVPLLQNHPGIQEILPFDLDGIVALASRRFDLLLCADKSTVSGALATRVRASEKRGFGADEHGVVVPLNAAAAFLYEAGLDDELKFRKSPYTHPELLARTFGLEPAAEPYRLFLDPSEAADGPPRKVGFNTGCSPRYPQKALDVDIQEQAARLVATFTGEPVLLLGGPEDAARNAELARRLGPLAERSPEDDGLRRGAAQVDRCDVVVTGDSLGLHLAVALGKHVVAWFGPTCPQEIALYGRGIRILADVDCAPCWKRSCGRKPSCSSRVDPSALAQAVLDGLVARTAGTPIDDFRGAAWYRN